MAERDSNPNPLDPRSSSSRTTTLETSETTGTPGYAGTYGAGNPGSGYSGTSSTGGSSSTTGGSSPTNWQRAGQESQTGGHGGVHQVKEEAKGLASEARQEALGIAGQAREHVQNLVGERKDRAAEQLGSFAGSLRDAASKLEGGDGGGATALGRYAQTAADQVDRVSQYLRDRDLRAFVRDAETFARRHPDVFLGGTFIAGLILARFFKASERRHQDELAGDWQGYAQSTGAYGSTYGGTSYGNTYNTGTPAGAGSATGSTPGGSSESAWSPGGPVPPVGG